MKKTLLLSIAAFVAVALFSTNTFAARSATTSTTTEQVGYDISYPQCGSRLPSGQYFGIVGVNGGTAATTNSCLASQLTWANGSLGGSNQSKVQLYVNTANPGEVINQVTTWPTSNTDSTGFTTTNPYGTCAGQNDKACSWQYGWNRAVEDNVNRFTPAAQTAGVNTSAGAYTWWLDVETGNTWQTADLSNNAVTLEGMTAYFESLGAHVGLYSTAAQWSTIVGSTVTSSSNLNGLANWRPSGSSLSNAKANCTVAPLTTGGFISLTQYVVKSVDNDHSCI